MFAKRNPATSKLTIAAGAPVPENQNSMTAGPRGPMLLQDVWHLEKLAHFAREVIPEQRMHAKGSGAFGHFTATHNITQYSKARLFSAVGKKTELAMRFSTMAGERGAADAERDIRGFAMKFYTEKGNWALVATTRRCSFCATCSSSQTSTAPSNATRAPTCAAPKATGTSGRCCPRRCTRSPS